MSLTPAQYKQLADRVIHTRLNVYDLARSMFDGHGWTDEDFDLLAEHGRVFRCGECSIFEPMSGVSNNPNMCQACADDYEEEEDE